MCKRTTKPSDTACLTRMTRPSEATALTDIHSRNARQGVSVTKGVPQSPQTLRA